MASETENGQVKLSELGVCFVLNVSHWSGKASNDGARDFEVGAAEAERKAISSWGKKALVNPDLIKDFGRMAQSGRQAISLVGRPFLGGWFVPWSHVQWLRERLEKERESFDKAAEEFCAAYPLHRSSWCDSHPGIPEECYALVDKKPMADRFSWRWQTFSVKGADLAGVDGAEADNIAHMREALQEECATFVASYIEHFRGQVAEFCDQVVEAKGAVHGKTLSALKKRIAEFQSLNVFGDLEADTKLDELKAALGDYSGQDVKSRPILANSIAAACKSVSDYVLDADNVSEVAGRLKRRVVLD